MSLLEVDSVSRRFGSLVAVDNVSMAVEAGELRAFRHEGFWDCMDTYKDAIELGDLWAAGDAPWKVWSDSGSDKVGVIA